MMSLVELQPRQTKLFYNSVMTSYPGALTLKTLSKSRFHIGLVQTSNFSCAEPNVNDLYEFFV